MKNPISTHILESPKQRLTLSNSPSLSELKQEIGEIGPERALAVNWDTSTETWNILLSLRQSTVLTVCTENAYPLLFVCVVRNINDLHRYVFNDFIIFFDEQASLK